MASRTGPADVLELVDSNYEQRAGPSSRIHISNLLSFLRSNYLDGLYLPKNASIISVTSSYEIKEEDSGKIIECSGTFSVNCPNGLSKGVQVAIVNVGSGVITITADTTLQSKNGSTTMTNQYGMSTVYHRGSNIWLLAGDLF